MPYFFSGKPALAFDTDSKNDRAPIGLIGCGGMGTGNINSAKQWLDVLAYADADAGRAEGANKKFSEGKGDVYADYRKILERDDIKTVHLSLIHI